MFLCKMPVGGEFWKAAGNIGLELQRRDLDMRFKKLCEGNYPARACEEKRSQGPRPGKHSI